MQQSAHGHRLDEPGAACLAVLRGLQVAHFVHRPVPRAGPERLGLDRQSLEIRDQELGRELGGLLQFRTQVLDACYRSSDEAREIRID